ncbi:hypothetical protein [Alterisphingorhabdus coralli]|uniref:RHS repeat protein n=1 Tax=Alterisphingorhabdus coralli TaxID=3071408 RepID=A0AA97F709_9SPHN|nr:hypothetical protein [Parasphingorhabdus sp. SCSIO 66989]WOE75549.1 hypothetical protein RB602_02210 [Parasphingorhabdus sp. SCSIO 66989]
MTDYEYASSHGGVTRVRGPAVGGVRPETRYSYGQYYAWTRAGSGSSFVRAATPVWLLSSERTCISSAMTSSGCAGGAADQVVTNYQYEAGNASRGSNLLLLGTAVTARNASGQTETLRTCYAYDDQGRRISETSPRANLSSCPS